MMARMTTGIARMKKIENGDLMFMNMITFQLGIEGQERADEGDVCKL